MTPTLHISRCAALAVALLAAGTPLSAQESSDKEENKNGAGGNDAAVAQIYLDLASFSPGSIDGEKGGIRTRNALKAFQQASGLEASGELDEKTMARLKEAAGGKEPYTQYTITQSDASGPFSESAGTDWKKMASMNRLGYTSAAELLGEKFHASPEFLKKLNPGASFKAGESIKVPNVEPFSAPAGEEASGSGKTSAAEEIHISAPAKTLTVKGEGGKVVFFAPITPGSKSNPVPSGEYKVNGVEKNPKYAFDPAIITEADVKEKLDIPPGPNSPVGVVWIDLSAENYGLHGTPEPEKIGYTSSHGCVRLTNWDAIKLASMVRPGTRVVFER